MLKDNENPELKNITLRQDKYLWIAREYQKQKIDYTEIADSDLVKANGPAIQLIKEVHGIMPYIEKRNRCKNPFISSYEKNSTYNYPKPMIGGKLFKGKLRCSKKQLQKAHML